MQCPLAGWAIIICAGCGLGALFPNERAYAAAALVLLLVASLALCHQKIRARTFWLAWLAAFAVATTLGARVGDAKKRELAFVETHRRDTIVEGWISAVREGKSSAGNDRHELTLQDITLISPDGTRMPLSVARLEMRCYSDIPGADFQPGEWWRFSASRNPWLAVSGEPKMRPRLTASGNFSQAERMDCNSAAFMRGLMRLRKNVASRLGLGVAPERAPEAAIVCALLLGLREDIPSDTRGFFRYSGTGHLFAISGLVVGMVALMMAWPLRFTRLRYDRWGLVLIPGILFYGALTGAAPSAVRACLMLTVYWLVPLFGVRVSALSAISAAAVLLVGFEPANILDMGFWLSFTVTAGLIVFTRHAQKFFEWLFIGRENADVAKLLSRHEPAWRKWLRRHIAALAAVSLTAWVMAAPVGIYFFEQFVPGGMLANMVIVPLVFFVVCLAGASLALGLVWTQGAALLNNAMVSLVQVMHGGAVVFAAQPLGAYAVKWPFGIAGLVCAYLALAVFGFWLHARFAQDGELDF